MASPLPALTAVNAMAKPRGDTKKLMRSKLSWTVSISDVTRATGNHASERKEIFQAVPSGVPDSAT